MAYDGSRWPTAHRSPAAKQAFELGRSRPGVPATAFGQATPVGTPGLDFGRRPLQRPGFVGPLSAPEVQREVDRRDVRRFARAAGIALGFARQRVPYLQLAQAAYEIATYRERNNAAILDNVPPVYVMCGGGFHLREVCLPPARQVLAFVYGTPGGFNGLPCLQFQAGTGLPFPGTCVVGDQTVWYWQQFDDGFGNLRHDTLAIWDKFGTDPSGLNHVVGDPGFRAGDLVAPVLAPRAAAKPGFVKPHPQPLPWRAIPHTEALPLSPQTRVGDYYAPGTRPAAPSIEVGVSVAPDGRVRPLPRAASSTGGAAAPPWNPQQRAPASAAKEKKFSGGRGLARGLQALMGRSLAGLSELNDFVDSLYKALPRSVQARYPRNMFGRAEAVAENMSKIDVQKAIVWLAYNELEDKVVGRAIRRARNQANRLDPAGGLWSKINFDT